MLFGSFPHLSGMVLEKKISDHRPILFSEHIVDYGPYSFRLFHSSFNVDGFDVVVRDSWNSPIMGCLIIGFCSRRSYNFLNITLGIRIIGLSHRWMRGMVVYRILLILWILNLWILKGRLRLDNLEFRLLTSLESYSIYLNWI